MTQVTTEARVVGPKRPLAHVVRPAVTLALVVIGAVFLWDSRSQLGQGLQLVLHISGWWLLAAALAEGVSLISFAVVQQRLLRSRGVPMGASDMVRIALAGNGLSNVLPGGSALAAAWTWRQFRTRGASRGVASWVMIMSGVISSVALGVMIIAGIELVGNRGPAASLRWVAAAVGFGALGALLGLRLLRGRERFAGLRRTLAFEDVAGADWLVASGLSLVNWMLDLVCLVASLDAVGARVAWPAVMAAYGLSQLLNALPITPGGIGVIEAGLTALLVAYGMPGADAIAAVIVYRAVSFWAPTPIGLVFWLKLHRATVAPDASLATAVIGADALDEGRAAPAVPEPVAA